MAQTAIAKADAWLRHAVPQSHDPVAQRFDLTLLQLFFQRREDIDLRDPKLFSDLLSRKTLLIYALAQHAGVSVMTPFSPEHVRAEVKATFDQLEKVPGKQWSRVDLASVHLLLEIRHGHPERLKPVVDYLCRFQSADGSFCHNPVSTAIAYLALTLTGGDSDAWRRCRQYILSSQQPDGTWRFCTSDVWDTTLTLRSLRGHPRFRSDAQPKALQFLLSSQNPDGGWGFQSGAESDNDTTGAALLALAGTRPPAIKIQRALHYVRERQLPSGLWTTWQARNDLPVEDTVAHVMAGLQAWYRSHTISTRAAGNWLLDQFAQEGRWAASWYRNFPYAVLEISRAIGSRHPTTQLALRDLLKVQNPDGGWGPVPGEPSLASATGQAIAALVQILPHSAPPVRRAIRFMLDSQRPDGSWPGRPEMYGPRPLLSHLPTHTQALAMAGLMPVWHRLQARHSA